MVDLKTILVTTDLTETSKKAFPMARELAARFQAEIVLVHCMEDWLPPLAVEYSHAGFRDVERINREHSHSRLAEYGAELGDNVALELIEGTPHLEIVRLAEEKKVDLIVMATHGRGFVSHAFLGSTTERVLRRAPCPVVVVRDPEASPI